MELLAGQQRLQAVLDSIDDGLLMIDRQGRLEHLNPVAQRQLGWDTDRLGQGLGTALSVPSSMSSSCNSCCVAEHWSGRRRI